MPELVRFLADQAAALSGLDLSQRASLGAAEFSGGEIPSPVPAGTTRHRSVPFPGRFGYGDNVRALDFGKNSYN